MTGNHLTLLDHHHVCGFVFWRDYQLIISKSVFTWTFTITHFKFLNYILGDLWAFLVYLPLWLFVLFHKQNFYLFDYSILQNNIYGLLMCFGRIITLNVIVWASSGQNWKKRTVLRGEEWRWSLMARDAPVIINEPPITKAA